MMTIRPATTYAHIKQDRLIRSGAFYFKIAAGLLVLVVLSCAALMALAYTVDYLRMYCWFNLFCD